MDYGCAHHIRTAYIVEVARSPQGRTALGPAVQVGVSTMQEANSVTRNRD